MLVAEWADGVWCEIEEIEEYLSPPCAKSDDYKIVEYDETDEI
jgi:hypothetical protein